MAFGKHWTRSECLMSDGYQLFYPLAKLPSPNYLIHLGLGLPWCSVVENLPSSPRDAGSIPGSGRPLEKEMATHSSTFAWRILQTEEPGGLQSMGWLIIGHHLVTKQQQQSGHQGF